MKTIDYILEAIPLVGINQLGKETNGFDNVDTLRQKITLGYQATCLLATSFTIFYYGNEAVEFLLDKIQ